MKHLRYRGEFLSVGGITWRADIMQESNTHFAPVGELSFDAAEPIVIEWGAKSKEAVICGSTATIKIISPGDRTFEDLYSIEAGRVRLDVYRNDFLYWSGCIDTEFYEEPYESLKGYTVSLSFTDFGVLDRLKYSLSDMRTLKEVLDFSIGRSGILCGGIDENLISTSLTPAGSPLKLSDIKVRSDNFYDEEGEAKTLAEVVEGVLQPLALRMVQRAGKVYIYDINALYTKGSTRHIHWTGDHQTMGVDKVFNNVKITWSPYAQSGNLYPEKCWGDIETSANLTALDNLEGGSKNGAKYFTYHYHPTPINWNDQTDTGFTFWVSKEGKNAILKKKAHFFRIVPQYDGTESEGIAIHWATVKKITTPKRYSLDVKDYGCDMSVLKGDPNDVGGMIFKTEPIWLPPVEQPENLSIRIAFDMLLDPRFNPFEAAEDYDTSFLQKKWYEDFNTYATFVYVPVSIKFKPEGSSTVYVWDNRGVVTKPFMFDGITSLNETFGEWVIADEISISNWGYLCYYEAKDRAGTCGVLGWKKNRPAINPHLYDTLSALEQAEAGQYIPYPTAGIHGGKMWIEVRSGWYIAKGGTSDFSPEQNVLNSMWSRITWLLMKLPEIEIMNSRQIDKCIDTDDVEYKSEINSAAKESISIDTICGTSAGGVPTARGAYFNAVTGKQITHLTRAGRTTQAEDLLIGTLYSQFAQRRTALSGEASLMYTPLAAYIERNQEDKLFIAIEDVQDLRADSSFAHYVEIRPDEYRRNNE